MCEDKGRVGMGGDCVVVGDMIIGAIDGKTHSEENDFVRLFSNANNFLFQKTDWSMGCDLI